MEEKKTFLHQIHLTRIPLLVFVLSLAGLILYNILFQGGIVSMAYIKFSLILFGISYLATGIIAIKIREFQITRGLVLKDTVALALGGFNTITGIVISVLSYLLL